MNCQTKFGITCKLSITNFRSNHDLPVKICNHQQFVSTVEDRLKHDLLDKNLKTSVSTIQVRKDFEIKT